MFLEQYIIMISEAHETWSHRVLEEDESVSLKMIAEASGRRMKATLKRETWDDLITFTSSIRTEHVTSAGGFLEVQGRLDGSSVVLNQLHKQHESLRERCFSIIWRTWWWGASEETCSSGQWMENWCSLVDRCMFLFMFSLETVVKTGFWSFQSCMGF